MLMCNKCHTIRKTSVGDSHGKFPLHWLLDHFLCVNLNLVVMLNLKPSDTTQSLSTVF